MLARVLPLVVLVVPVALLVVAAVATVRAASTHRRARALNAGGASADGTVVAARVRRRWAVGGSPERAPRRVEMIETVEVPDAAGVVDRGEHRTAPRRLAVAAASTAAFAGLTAGFASSVVRWRPRGTFSPRRARAAWP